MSRPLRLDYPGALHHVTVRVNRREHVLDTRAARGAVFRLLEEAATRFETMFLAYAVMSNHAHLAVLSPDGRLSATMQHFTAGLTRVINAQNGWSGHVFQGRFFNRVVEDEAYARHLPAYIHLNPSAAGLDDRMLDPAWTSHGAFLYGSGPGWLQPGPLLGHFSDPLEYSTYVEDVRAGRRSAPVGFHEQVLLQPRSSDAMALPVASERDVVPLLTLHRIAEQVLGRVPVGARPGVAMPKRDLLVLWMSRQGHSQADISLHLGISRSCVSRAASRAVRRPDGLHTMLLLEEGLRARGLAAVS